MTNDVANLSFIGGRCGLRFLVTAVSLALVGGCGSQNDGLTKYPAQGTIILNGAPVAGLIVRLVSDDKQSTGRNSRFPVGVTDEQGVFRLSTNGQNDGAVVGDYTVTIVWPERNEPPLVDRLKGAYATPEKSDMHVTIEAAENIFEPIDLVCEVAPLGAAPARSEDD